ncbi:MAG: transposase [Magnetococcales bacterium]|nr:transposase [Magnetococcales bacterium]
MSDQDTSWGTVADLAGLPEMPQTQRGVRMLAERAGWLKRKRATGKGWEYHLGALPEAARNALKERTPSAAPLPVVVVEPRMVIPERRDALGVTDLKQWQRETMDARLVILREVERRAALSLLSEAVATVVALAADGTLPAEIQMALPSALAKNGKDKETLSPSTIHRWRAMAKRGMGALAPAPMDAGGTPAWVEPFMKIYRTPNRLTVAAVLRQMHEAKMDPGLIPSYSQARRYLERIGEAEAGKGRLSRLQLTAKLPFIRRSTSELSPMDIVNGDGHLSYFLALHPNTGKPTRLEFTEVFCVATRIHAGWSINYSENTHAVVDALRMAVEFGGVPKIVHWDNGSGAKNKNLQDEVSGLKSRLGFEFYHQTPGNPQAGGIVERGHQQVLIPAARRFDSYVGRRDKDDGLLRIRMKAIQEGKIRLPTIPEVVEMIDKMREIYNNTPHSSLPWMFDKVTGKKRHETPKEAWQRHVDGGWKPVRVDNALEEFRLEETRTVLRGEIRFHTMIYSNPTGLKEWHNKKVRVRYDPRDGSKVWVWSLDKHDRLICEATRDGNVRPYLVDNVLEHGGMLRLRGQLARLDRKKLEKLAEARQTLEMVVEPLTIAQEEAANAMIEQLGMGESRTAEIVPLHEAQILESGFPARPVFSGTLAEEAWGKWAMANMDQLDEEELDKLESRLEDPWFRRLLGFDDDEGEGDGDSCRTKRRAGHRE